MNRERYLLPVLFLVSGIVSSGCSTFEVRDVYQVAGSGTGAIEYNNEAMELQIEFAPDTQVASVGVFGAPIIPAYVQISDRTEVTLAVHLVLHRDHPFSFSAASCLSVEPGQALCPYQLTVASLGMFQDDGTMYEDKQKRWNHITHFHAKDLSLQRPENNERVSRERIYLHYGYAGVPKWEYLRADLTYKYRCEGHCPERFELNTEQLVVVGGTPCSPGDINSRRSGKRIIDSLRSCNNSAISSASSTSVRKHRTVLFCLV